MTRTWKFSAPPPTAFASLSVLDLEKQIGSDGATWLDRRLLSPDTSDLAPAGFDQQLRDAMNQRREHHIEQVDAMRQQNGRIFYRRNLLATLREREVVRIGAEMAESMSLPFRAATDSETVSGKFTGTVQLSSGKFAMVEKSHELTLVPWRPVIDRQLGREVILVLAALTSGAPLSLVAPMREISMMVGPLMGMVILREKVGPWRLVGCGVLIAGVILLSST